MELFEQILNGAFLLLGVPFIAFLIIMIIVRAIRGTDLKDFDAMRTTNPVQFRKMVWICRYNGVMVIGLGLLSFFSGLGILIAGLAPVDLPTASGGAFGTVVGVGITWIAFRWCRWGWRTKLD